MTPIQQMLLGLGAGKKTYLDDLFSIDMWHGNNTIGRTINNGIDLDTEEGLVWVKKLNTAENHVLLDTVRGPNNFIFSDGNNTANTSGGPITAFNNNGFTLDNNGYVNANNSDYASWTFKESPGFFDIVSYTGTGSGSAITVSHNLGSMPGFIAIKDLDNSESWICWHHHFGYSSNADYVRLNQNYAMGTDGASPPNGSINSVTATQMVIGKDHNANNADYIVYVFGGGKSTASNATSVDFDGNASGGHMDELSIPTSTDFDLGSTFTWEFWIKMDNLQDWYVPFRRDGTNQMNIQINASGTIMFDRTGNNVTSETGAITKGQWTHCALVVNSGVGQWYINGTASGSSASSVSGSGYDGPLVIGGWGNNSSYYIDGKISNLRLVKGTAVYTSSFRPPTEPLKNITNTVLLCCNGSSVTSATVTPNTISDYGDVTASTDSPFYDTAGFVFGDSKEGIVKTGSYVGSGSAGLEVNVGFEPQWILFKSLDTANSWYVLDAMRGVSTAADDKILAPNTTSAEWDSSYLSITPTGFKVETSHVLANGNNNTYIWVAIRRPDAYVAKPVETATDVFAIDTGNSDEKGAFTSNFPVDFAMVKEFAGTSHWEASARLIQGKYLQPNEKGNENNSATFAFNNSTRWLRASAYSSSYQSWMWKRHAGFDVVTYKGNGVQGRDVPHNLSVAPEMMWVKNRTRSLGGGADWHVYVSGITHLSVYGSDPDSYGNNPSSMELNTQEKANFSMSGTWDHTHPTSTHFRLGDTYTTNQSGEEMIAFLFASVTGMSKIGTYTGNGSTTGPTITLGFAPKFIIIKRLDDNDNWNVFDTTRGLVSGNDPLLKLNVNNAQLTGYDLVDPTSDGFQLATTDSAHNANGGKFLYYAHA